jgi:hypothetical protein
VSRLEIDTLVLEDSYERKKYFIKFNPKSIVVDNPRDCLSSIKSAKKINQLWLDYDLGEGRSLGSSECGMDVVDYLVNNKESVHISEVFIHSMNPYPSQVMFEKLKSAGYMVNLYPFNIFKAKLDNFLR